VNVLFFALLIVVLGSMAGQYASVMHYLPGDLWFWFGVLTVRVFLLFSTFSV
jgi:nitric oxide reductase large subunit